MIMSVLSRVSFLLAVDLALMSSFSPLADIVEALSCLSGIVLLSTVLDW